MRPRVSKLDQILLLAACFLLICASGCSGGGGGSDNSGGSNDEFTSGGGTPQRIALDSYVNDIAIASLRNIDGTVARLQSNIASLLQNPSSANMVLAKQSWIDARVAWEQNEASLFGPIEAYGFDAEADTWPVDTAALSGILAGSADITEERLSGLANNLKGFHVIEYLIWGESGEKQPREITPREALYLTAAVNSLKDLTGSLLAAWISGYAGQGAYASEVVLAGQGSDVFPSENLAIQQFVNALIGICDEVSELKLAEPFVNRNPQLVESLYSANTLTDVSNNILAARNIYNSVISALIITDDPALDEEVRSAFDSALAAIADIPPPYSAAILSSANDGKISAAEAAVRALRAVLNDRVLPLVAV